VIKTRRIRWAGIKHLWGRSLHRVLVGRRKGKRPLGSPSRRWKVNIKTDLQEMECEGMD